jgi:hypothetical protein
MDTRKRLSRSLGAVFYLIGILLALVLAGGAAWADFEAEYYGFDRMANKALRTLRCPVLMAASETGHISATFSNSTERSIQLMVRADFSNPGPPRSVRTTLPLAPGERKQLEWAVTSDNVDLGWFIFARVYTYPAYPYPFRQGTCGIIVINLAGLTGSQVFALMITASLLGILVGLGLWERSKGPSGGRRLGTTSAMRFLAVIVLLALLTSLMGWWGIAGLFVVVALLLLSVLAYFLLTEAAGRPE